MRIWQWWKSWFNQGTPWVSYDLPSALFVAWMLICIGLCIGVML